MTGRLNRRGRDTTPRSLKIESLLNLKRSRRTGGAGLTAYVEDEEAAVGPVVASVGVPVRMVRAHRPTLDDVFLHYTGREIREQHSEGAMPMFARAHGAHRR